MGVKRLLVLVCGSLLGAALPVAVSAAQAPRAQLRSFICQRALEPASRALSVTAVMRPLPGTVGMELRVDLLTHASGASSFSPVHSGDLGVWKSPPNPTLGRRPGDVWILNKQVVDLAAPAAYRLRVWYRWIGPHRRVIGTALRRTPICLQPELRPDLVLRKVEVSTTQTAAVDAYVATIANAGATAAGPFRVRFSPGGSAPGVYESVSRLGAHAVVRVRFLGPVCTSASPPTITVDPDRQVEDYNLGNNSETVSCPAASAPAGTAAAGR